MTRKYFNLIAETIKLMPSTDVKGVDMVRFDVVCNVFADALASTNPRFDRQRFISACKGQRESMDSLVERVSRVVDSRKR